MYIGMYIYIHNYVTFHVVINTGLLTFTGKVLKLQYVTVHVTRYICILRVGISYHKKVNNVTHNITVFFYFCVIGILPCSIKLTLYKHMYPLLASG